MKNIVKLLESDVIYVQKAGSQTQQSMMELFSAISKLAIELRARDKRVLILSNAEKEESMNGQTRKIAAAIGRDLDYDKSATYGATRYMDTVRGLMIKAIALDEKVADFETREEALEWLTR